MCELTLHLLQCLYFITVGGTQSGISVQCILFIYTFKLSSYHSLFRERLRSGTDGCVVDWFSSMNVPWIPVANIHDKLSFLRRVCSKSISALLDYNFSASNPIIIRLVVFL